MRKAVLWFVGITTAGTLVMAIVQLSQFRGHLSTDLNELHVPVAWVVTIFAAIFGVALGNASRGPWETPILAIIASLTCGIAVLLWQRVEILKT